MAAASLFVSRSDTGKHSKYYDYDPSKVAAIIFLVLFAAVTFTHLYQMVRTKTWYFTCFCIGGILEVVGFLARAMSAFETPNWTKSIFIIQTLGILLAPTLFAASVYMVLGRIILLTEGEALSFVRRTWLTKIFVAGDVVSFLVQALGGTMIVSGEPDKVSKGQTIILIGLFIQIVFFGLFMTNSFVFMLRLRSHPTSRSQNVPWMKHLCSLFFVSGLILIRSIYRVIEYTQGSGGTLMTHEVYLYVLDTALMFLVMVAFVIIHPSEITAHYQGGKVAFFFSSYEVLKGYDGRTQGSVDLLPLNHGNVRV